MASQPFCLQLLPCLKKTRSVKPSYNSFYINLIFSDSKRFPFYLFRGGGHPKGTMSWPWPWKESCHAKILSLYELQLDNWDFFSWTMVKWSWPWKEPPFATQTCTPSLAGICLLFYDFDAIFQNLPRVIR